MDEFRPKTADEFYASLPLYSDIRAKEISDMVQPFIEVTDRYGRLISRLTLVLGSIEPKDVQDRVVRDLMAAVKLRRTVFSVTSGSGTIFGCAITGSFPSIIVLSFPPSESRLLGGKCLTYIGTEG